MSTIPGLDTDNLNKDPALNISSELRDLRIQMCDYLFERGHRISKPLVDAAAQFAFDYGRSLYEQGKIAQVENNGSVGDTSAEHNTPQGEN